jgi:hypothetical protein
MKIPKQRQSESSKVKPYEVSYNSDENPPRFSFRFCGAVPMLGYRSTFGTFYIIAFDAKFKAYDHG